MAAFVAHATTILQDPPINLQESFSRRAAARSEMIWFLVSKQKHHDDALMMSS
jgi:hypothetical protein